jgi:cell cycle protein kinase DBF2
VGLYLKQIGKGGYGDVFLSRNKDTNEIVALKRMRKKALLAQNEIHHIFNERNVLSAANSPWLVKLLCSFQDSSHVYLAMVFIAFGYKKNVYL